jgi:DNA-binding CsgD family transcriptional regulator
MTYPVLKTSIKIGISTALAIILFQVSNIFLVYKYFKFDYYLTVVAVLFLISGFFVSKYKLPGKNHSETGEDGLLNLTHKELSILRLIIEGKTNKEIAAINYVEVSTIKTHINNIYAKLGLHNRREAINCYRGKL